ncbi:hypothetical protein JCM3775_006576 [Rhodotorula graminis]|uniref:Uncharacterized protein n=1 Tax=Rhodotorula graminis (strain WP1) TaxID=578459 RepID=A0A0P9GJJ2_RHOGW|nr:uncharacterized protein RHOBADRAFT_55405 [Rhodotorula graminis WP1]KPV73193.1 hypothetical protein RHOBADRAFT_55405 [Rhodotorula graminis WP1]
METVDQLSSPLADLALSSRVSKKVLFPLLHLPDELIEVVLEHAYGSQLPHDHPHHPRKTGLVLAHKPICRRLWPMQQRILYGRIEIQSYDELVSFERALVGNRRRDPSEPLGNLVRALGLRTWHFPDWLGQGGAGDHAGPGVPELAASLLSALFTELNRLQSLEVDLQSLFDSERSSPVEQALLAVVVHDPSTPVQLCGLKSLRISTFGNTLDTDLNGKTDDLTAWLNQFSRFPDLAHLDINLDTEAPPSFISGASPVRPILAQLSSLDINSDFALWNTPLRDVAPNLAKIKITSTSLALRPVVRGLPPSLLHLDISSEHRVCETIDDLLPPLFLLQSLSLNTACFTPIRLPASLGHLRHLESLDFGHSLLPTDGLLSRLVQGPTRLKHLHHLGVDFVANFYHRGPTLLRNKLVLPGESERDESGVRRGWCAPLWPAGLSERGLMDVVDAARKYGVRTDGWAVEALGWRAEYERERDLVAVCRGLSTGDWSDARRFCGDECVEAFLSRQRREGRRSSVGRELDLVSGFERRAAERRKSL